ncbi:hypothetical protein N9000_01045 [bacterium]|nr:hypothetical protein [bacterium]
MKQFLKIALVLASVSAQSNELDNLVNTSATIVGKIDTASIMVGSAIGYSNQGFISPQGLADSGKITQQELQAYNQALTGITAYNPYGDAQTFLENAADDELGLMHEAVDVFTEVVIDMVEVVKVNELAESASTPNEEAAVVDYVQTNFEQLQITEAEVQTYNQSLDDIEHHSTNAGAFLSVAANKDATNFLETGAANNNTTFDTANITFDANQQYVKVSWSNQNATAVYVNGNNFGIDAYVTEADVLAYGQQTEFYGGSPTKMGYDCFVQQINCEHNYEP